MSLSRLDTFENRLERRARVAKIPLNRLRDRENPLERYNAVQFKVCYHLYKDTAVYVAELISASISKPLRRGVHIPPLLQFLTVLRYYANGGFQISNADLGCVSQSTMSSLVKRVSTAIARMCSRFVKFPTFAEANKTRQEFYTICNLPGDSSEFIQTKLV